MVYVSFLAFLALHVGAWRSLVARLLWEQEVLGSNPGAPTTSTRSIPGTWVTVYSGDIGNTFGLNGFSIGSRRHVSSSK